MNTQEKLETIFQDSPLLLEGAPTFRAVRLLYDLGEDGILKDLIVILAPDTNKVPHYDFAENLFYLL